MLAQFLSVKVLKCFSAVGRRFICNTMSSLSRRYDIIYIAFPDLPVYLKQTDLKEIETESRTDTYLSRYFRVGKNTPCYLVLSENKEESDFQNCYIQSAINAQTIYRKSAEWQHVVFSHSVCKLRASVRQGSQDVYNRGVCVHGCATLDAVESLPDKLCDLAKQDSNFVPYELCRSDKNNALTLRCLTDRHAEDQEIYFSISSYPEDEASTLSPLFTIPEISPVYHSYEEAISVLEKMADVPEVKELLEISSKHISMEMLSSHKDPLPHPFVVVEGMDATGKTTLTEELEKRMQATRFYTPPRQITHLRAHFDKYPEIVRRAYYSMGNYIVAGEIIEECQSKPVIMDRFWHSTTAYGIANETSAGDIPPEKNPVYCWPSDLVRPTLVLFLTVTEEVRKQRLSGRGVQATFEEKSLDSDWLFRSRLCESYRRMYEPSCIEIDAGGTVEQVRDQAVQILLQHGVNFDHEEKK